MTIANLELPQGDAFALASGAALVSTRPSAEVKPAVSSSSTKSVFDEPSGRPQPAPAGSVSGMANQPVAPSAAPVGLLPTPPLRPIPQRGANILAIGAGAVTAVVLAATVWFFSRPDDPVAVETVIAETTTTTTVVQVDEPAETGDPSESTSTTPPTTTTTTTTTTTQPPVTTTTPTRVALPGLITLNPDGLYSSTIPVVQFGDAEADVLTELSGLLGAPTSDTGSTSNDFCEGDSARLVRWGNLEVVFTGEPDDRLFTQWFADGVEQPEDLVTVEGFGVTATVGFMDVVFGLSYQLVPLNEGSIVGLFAVTNPATGAVLSGTTLGLDGNGVVTSLWAGDSCARAF